MLCTDIARPNGVTILPAAEFHKYFLSIDFGNSDFARGLKKYWFQDSCELSKVVQKSHRSNRLCYEIGVKAVLTRAVQRVQAKNDIV